ncbi:MAG: hypothetical protein EON60_03870 [Alphaproteobacteria bacterium]|nr:MAG: hypothetical protein EON60_03870 [Alphaproteobacteria bacterium]
MTANDLRKALADAGMAMGLQSVRNLLNSKSKWTATRCKVFLDLVGMTAPQVVERMGLLTSATVPALVPATVAETVPEAASPKPTPAPPTAGDSADAKAEPTTTDLMHLLVTRLLTERLSQGTEEERRQLLGDVIQRLSRT